MKSIIDDVLKKNNIQQQLEGRGKYSITHASVKREERVLSVDITLNFIMPISACDEIKKAVKEKLQGKVRDVQLNFTYQDVIHDTEELLKLFLPHMIRIINGNYAGITRAIQTDSVRWDGEQLHIYAVVEFTVELLNSHVRKVFEKLIRESFGMKVRVEFKNNQELFRRESEAFRQTEKEEINRSLEEYAKSLKERASSSSAKEKEPAERRGQWKGKKREKELPACGSRIMGHTIGDSALTPLRDIDPSLNVVVVEGTIFKITYRLIKSGNYLMTLLLTDDTTTICTKAFVSEEKHDEIETHLSQGDSVKIRGQVQWDTFENLNVIMIKDLEKEEKLPGRQDTWSGKKRVELHAHTKMSAMDGLNEPADIVNQAAEWGQPAVAITDHGVVQAFPDAAKAAKKLKAKGKEIKVIYGMEGYVFDDEGLIEEDGTIDYKARPTNHIILLAATQEGMKNIYKLVSYSHLDYFYKRPRLPKSVIRKHREGIIIGSACEAGELYQAFYHQKSHE